MQLLVIVMCVSAALAGCGKKKDEGSSSSESSSATGKVVASCDQRNVPMASVKVCLEYTGNVWTKKEVQARCGMEGQVFIDGACPTEGVVFTCVQESGKPMEAYNRYYENAEKAAQVCKTIGVPK